ncbi:PREDICTED: uncharacterized protein LOC109205606 [Nicotiana attenuata]|uniref:Enhancer of polycomb-like protein n=1 Tax=Nicotiana attenuata TaxID=49451 RepID=A0A314KYD7_NICAT|nr:PREDICTED: uncharacterized protein LOC109205606 [Nicotiana attenuata]OIT33749.1 hypothetical protein A4A49_24347 [Nicotiana attenuata]
MESGVEEKSGGGSVENSKKQRSLDLQTLYKFGDLKKVKFSAEDSDIDVRKKKKKKRKSIKEVSLDKPEPSGKKSRTNTDEDHVNGGDSGGPVESQLSSSGLEKRLNYSNGLNGFSLSLDSNGNAIPIPKRPRGSVGRRKFDSSGRGSQLSSRIQTSVIGNGKLKSEPEETEGDQLPKKRAFSGGEAKSDEGTSKLPSSSAGNGVTVKVKRKISVDESREKKKDKASSIRHAKEDGHVAVNNGEASSRKHRSTRNKRKDLSSSSRKSVKRGLPSGDNFGSFCQDSLDDDDEENLEQNAARMLSSRFDPSCTGFSSKSRSSASLSAERLSSLLTSGQDFVSREGNSLAGSESASVDTASRVLRPRQKFKARGISRKRRHFYEVLPKDLDAYWVLNRRIKVFWPLDESWYYGLLNDYDPERKLHHVKYDDRDEEWINLETERFKLLLLPVEVPGKKKVRKSANVKKNIEKRKLDLTVDDDSHPGNSLDSEPIISWLARSSRRVKSSPSRPSKKQKSFQLSTPVVSSPLHAKTESTNWNLGSLNNSKGKPDCDLLFPDKLIDLSKAENSFGSHSSHKDRKPVVYVRRRFHKKRDGLLPVYEADKAYGAGISTVSVAPAVDGLQNCNTSIMCIPGPEREKLLPAVNDEGVLRLNMPLLEAKQFRVEICLPTLPLLLLEAEQIWLSHTVLLLQHGAIVIRWPKIILEMLFVDNAVGLRFLLFECCLNHAMAFIFFVLTLFNQADEAWRFESLQLPVTSVRFRLSSIQDSRKQQSFAFYCFSKLKYSKWLYLDSKLQKRSLLAKQLPLSECTYENIKSLDCRSEQLQFNAHADPSSFKKKLVLACLPTGTSIECSSARLTSSTFSSAMKLGRIPPFALSFAAAPTFFICLHLRLLMERNFACVSLQDYDSINACQPVKDDGSRVECSDIAENIVASSTGATGGSSFAERKLGSLACKQQLSEHVSLKSSQNCQLDITQSSFIAKHSELGTSDVIVVSNKSESVGQGLDQFVASPGRRQSNNISHSLSSARCHSGLVGMSVVIPSFDQVEGLSEGKGIILGGASHLTLNKSDGMISSPNLTVTSNVVQCPIIAGMSDHMVQSPNPSGPRGLLCRNRNSSSSSPFGEISPVLVDGKTNFTRGGFGNGPKKPRTQVQYTLPYGGYDLGSMHRNHSPRTLPYKRIRRASEKKNADNCSGSQRNIELLSCDANVLVTVPDKGWREFGARVVLEIAGHNEWRIAVKFSGVTKYSYKVHNILQPGSTNRFTHAMMWKGGKDWVLEFPDRSQWMLFKEMHEECYNRNIRAASVKNIPIPGVRLIEEIEDYASEVSFIRSSAKYYRQVESDVDMAMDPSHILYDMDSEDEQWLSKNNFSCSGESKCEEISDELFEKTMDMFEKVAYARQRDHFTPDELEELMVGVGSMEVVRSVYDHWGIKRQKKGMALIRHLQPPLWERYQQQLKDWEQAMSNANLGFASVGQEKAASVEKPPMSAFCLKPRGLEVPNKGSKQRSHRKISVSGHSHAVPRDQDGLHPFGRRLNGYAHGDEMVVYQSHEYSDGSPMLHPSPRVFSPREASGFFSLNSDVSDWNHQPKFYRNKPKKIGSFHSLSNRQMVASFDQRTVVKRNGVHRWNMGLPEWPSQKHQPEGSRGLAIEQFDSSDLHEFRLHDASGAAQHALNMAKLKRERAQRLLYRADLAIHKAVVALMTAEAIKAAAESTNVDG